MMNRFLAASIMASLLALPVLAEVSSSALEAGQNPGCVPDCETGKVWETRWNELFESATARAFPALETTVGSWSGAVVAPPQDSRFTQSRTMKIQLLKGTIVGPRIAAVVNVGYSRVPSFAGYPLPIDFFVDDAGRSAVAVFHIQEDKTTRRITLREMGSGQFFVKYEACEAGKAYETWGFSLLTCGSGACLDTDRRVSDAAAGRALSTARGISAQLAPGAIAAIE